MIADSLSWVHIPLPAVRSRQRSWGTSLPQSVVLICLVCKGFVAEPGTASCRVWMTVDIQKECSRLSTRASIRQA